VHRRGRARAADVEAAEVVLLGVHRDAEDSARVFERRARGFVRAAEGLRDGGGREEEEEEVEEEEDVSEGRTDGDGGGSPNA
jgi:hypothetical protein